MPGLTGREPTPLLAPRAILYPVSTATVKGQTRTQELFSPHSPWRPPTPLNKDRQALFLVPSLVMSKRPLLSPLIDAIPSQSSQPARVRRQTQAGARNQMDSRRPQTNRLSGCGTGAENSHPWRTPAITLKWLTST